MSVIQQTIHAFGTFLDLSALMALLGISWCLFLMAKPAGNETYPDAILVRLRRLLLFCLTILIVTSIDSLIQRALEMSNVGVAKILPVLPLVLKKTHYGSMWFLRLAGLVAAWIIFLAGRRHPGSSLFSAGMFCSVSIIAFSRSATGHPADFGDFSSQQIADWVHLLAVSSWVGILIVVPGLFSKEEVEASEAQQRLLSSFAPRFYRFFGPLLSMLVLTGAYNAWFTVGSFNALVTTPYGLLLSAKLAAVCALILRYVAPPEYGRDDLRFATVFLRRIRVDAFLVVPVLLVVSVLVHKIPALHQEHLQRAASPGGHVAHKRTPGGPEPAVSLNPDTVRIIAGIPVKFMVRLRDQYDRPLKGVELSHERMLHAVIVGKDLAFFAHIHPEDSGPVTEEMLKKATFPLQFTFPRAGEYLMGIDFAAEDNSYSKKFTITVSEKSSMGEPVVDFSTEKNFGEYSVVLKLSPPEVRAGRDTVFKYVILKKGKPVTDLEPYLGAAMHLAVVPADFRTFIHVHGVTPGALHEDHTHAVPHEKFGPEIDAEVVFPSAGVYKIFSQVKHRGRVLLLDFMVNVQ